jgi:hypothetical protein
MKDIYDFLPINHNIEVHNRIFCTFSLLDDLDNLLENLTKKYSIAHNKIFILSAEDSNEYVCTYNIDQFNMSEIPSNTILVHRKKEFNVLYSLNSLNEIIKKHNNGVIDKNFIIDWANYRNSILLTNRGEFKQIKTKLYRIIAL